jgi:hypothetical protein
LNRNTLAEKGGYRAFIWAHGTLIRYGIMLLFVVVSFNKIKKKLYLELIIRNWENIPID